MNQKTKPKIANVTITFPTEDIIFARWRSAISCALKLWLQKRQSFASNRTGSAQRGHGL
jgi:hypothetical protein